MRQSHSQSTHRAQERGTIAVELAISMPIILLVFTVAVVFTDLSVTKNLMTTSLSHMARVCGARTDNIGGCLQDALLNANISNGLLGRKCSDLQIGALEETDDWFRVTLQCQYDGYKPERILGLLSNGDVGFWQRLWQLEVETIFAKYGVD